MAAAVGMVLLPLMGTEAAAVGVYLLELQTLDQQTQEAVSLT
jgi:hypothetical protein